MKKYLIRFLPYLGIAFFFSLFINLLQLTYVLYLRLLFDKVRFTRSEGSGETLFFLTAGAIGAFILLGFLEAIRSKLLIRLGIKFDKVVAGEVFQKLLHASIRPGSQKHTMALKDVNTLRNFFSGSSVFAFFDTPWVPIYLYLVFIFHPYLGYVATAGASILLLMVLAQELLTARLQKKSLESSQDTENFLNTTMRNAQSVHAMGMLPALTRIWKRFQNKEVKYEDKLSARTAFFQSLNKVVMMGTVMIIMSTGAYLVILHEATIGTMVAASMIMGKALAPILMLVSAWKTLVDSRISYFRLSKLFKEKSTFSGHTMAEIPHSFSAHGISHTISGHEVLHDIDLEAKPGELLAIVGPSGAGKSTLARILLGLWKPTSGQVFLDGEDIMNLDKTELGKKIGYMPQEVNLFTTTVAENIARMGEIDSEKVVEAAKLAGAHEMILGLPQGYDTRIGPGNVTLSGGQRQRIALARALYGNPWLLLMDEPDSHLDQPGREALKDLMATLKEDQRALILISHNDDLSKIADKTLYLNKGHAQPITITANKNTAPALNS